MQVLATFPLLDGRILKPMQHPLSPILLGNINGLSGESHYFAP
jgi:hypothetical protein